MNPILPIAAGGLGLWAFSGSASGETLDTPSTIDRPVDEYPVIDYDDNSPSFDYFEDDSMTPANPIDFGYQIPETLDVETRNIAAVLKLIFVAESGGDYTKLVGGGNFTRGFSDHPSVTGEFPGIKRKDGRLTTAAGGYQITRTTWLDIKGKTRFGDFSPTSQDAAAIFLIERRRAMSAVKSGDMATVQKLLWNEWEFFQTARWGPTQVASTFVKYGGIVV